MHENARRVRNDVADSLVLMGFSFAASIVATAIFALLIQWAL